ncbi:hypothetical protein [Micromonospora sediminimaris]|uniref:Uncharacterized protein n=1 Tax=Micromonospora sediminimaris TaxID=547162 RepID=A0A9W5UVM9_9ACTN|nr:hypothetical protein [Micromonospora sediminimaris]GIJ35078.1 hypothetical protein Vse01_42260 [Micromonospora sediminimaris]SFD27151.1 hypothetical protein SAMN05216284_11417 [Micromonospora sediminimaris]
MTEIRVLVQLCEELSDDRLLAALGSALDGSGLNVSPVDPGRLRRFARRWLDAKTAELWERARATQTYRIWAETAGPEQVIEADDLATALLRKGVPGEIAAPAAVAMHRDEVARAPVYDVAFSCAERQTEYVQLAVSAVRATGLCVFFEKEMTYEWWGKNFIVEGRRVYGRSARYFVPFFSEEYLSEPRPRDALEWAMSAAVERGDDYILPVVVGDVSVPANLLGPNIGYLRADEHSPEQLAAALRAKVAASRASDVEPRDIGVIVRGVRGSQ